MSVASGVREQTAPFVGAPFAREHRFTVAEVIRLGAEGYLPDPGRVELVDGRIEIMPSDGDLHVYTLKRILAFFFDAITADPPLRASVDFHVKATLFLGPHNMREPDFMITAPVPHDRLPEPADVRLLIEASVTSQTRDLDEKRAVYAAAGVSEYWVWDAENRKLVVFRNPDGADYAEKTTLTEGAATPLFAPQIAMPLATLIPANN